MTFGTFSKSSLSEDIAARILTMIKDKQLHPGEKLPPERELATAMEVSRPSLREALRALSIMKIVEIRQGDGTYVSSLEPDILVDHLHFIFSLSDTSFLELFETRRIIEVGIVRLAALNISDEEISELENCLELSLQYVNDHEEFLKTDIKLHDLIVEATHNSILQRVMRSISELGIASRRRTVRIPGVPGQAVIDHKVIVDALKAHDPEAAAEAMLKHLKYVEHHLRQIYSNEDS